MPADTIPNTDPINHPDAFPKRGTNADADRIRDALADALCHAYALGYAHAFRDAFPLNDPYTFGLDYALAHPDIFDAPRP